MGWIQVIRGWLGRTTKAKHARRQPESAASLADAIQRWAEDAVAGVHQHSFAHLATHLTRKLFEIQPPSAADDAVVERFLERLPETDFQVLRHYKQQGKKITEIAEIMSMDVGEVRRSLVRTYSDLRWLTRPGPRGGGEPAEVMEGTPPVVAAMEKIA